MEIIPLEEGIFGVDKQKHFTLLPEHAVPEPGSLQMAVRPFLAAIHGELVLLDTGLDMKRDEEFLITALLREQHIDPTQITKVLLSHLHKDHLGGLGYFDGATYRSHFPNAAIYVQRAELAYALTQEGNPSYDMDVLKALSSLRNLRLQDDTQGEIATGIRFEVAGGHTPHLQVFWLNDGAETVFYGADNLPKKNYLDFHVAYKTDYDGRKAMALRQSWEQQAITAHWSVLLYHDLELPVLHIDQPGRKITSAQTFAVTGNNRA